MQNANNLIDQSNQQKQYEIINLTNFGKDDHQNKNYITIQLQNNSFLVRYSQLFKYSEFIQDEMDINEAHAQLNNKILEFLSKYNINESNAILFFKLLEDDDVKLDNNNYIDVYKLSKLFRAQLLIQVLKKYIFSHLRDVSLIINLILEKENKICDLYDELLVENEIYVSLESLLNNKINECLQNENFALLQVSTMYRILEKSDKESIDSEKLYEFIHESIEKRFTLFQFVDLRQLKDDKWEQIYREWKAQKDNQYNKFYEHLGIKLNYLEYIIELKLNLSTINHENEEAKKENENIDKANEEVKKENEEVKKENEDIDKANEEVKKENEEVKKENEDIDKANEEVKKENENIDKANEEVKKENEEVKKENEDIDKANEEVKKENEDINKANEEVKKENEEVKKENEDIDKVNEEVKKENEDIDKANEKVKKENENIDKENEGIKSSIPQIYLDFYHSKLFQEMKENSSIIETKIENIINQLQVTIQQENHAQDVKYKQLARERQKNELKRDLDSYNEKISSLKLKKISTSGEPYIVDSCSVNILNANLTKFTNLNKNSNLVKFSNNDPLILYQPEWPSYSRLKLPLKGKKPIFLEPSKKNMYHFSMPIHEKVLDANNRGFVKLTWKEVRYYPANIDENSIDDAIKNLFTSYVELSPILIFGQNYLNYQQFIQKLDSTKNLFSSLINDIENDILNEELPDKSFSKTNYIISYFDGVLSLLNVRFTNDELCPPVQNLLNELRPFYDQSRKYACDIESFTKRINQHNF